MKGLAVATAPKSTNTSVGSDPDKAGPEQELTGGTETDIEAILAAPVTDDATTGGPGAGAGESYEQVGGYEQAVQTFGQVPDQRQQSSSPLAAAGHALSAMAGSGPRQRLLFYTGVAALGVAGVVEWPIAAVVAAGTYVASRNRS